MKDTGPVATALEEIRERFNASTRAAVTNDPRECLIAQASASDVPCLLAAVEAVLKAADDWRYIHSARCAREVREAITAALTGSDRG